MIAKSIIVIGGITAAGKTRAALHLATEFNGELVGADSVQVYRGFDIGSAKPTTKELGDHAHHLLDVIDPNENIDAAHYASLADAAIADIAARGKVPIVVGGTGLWLRALLRGLVNLPPVDPTLREALSQRATQEGLPALYQELQRVDPTAAERIHGNDQLRIIRALEVHTQTGRQLSTLQAEHAKGADRYRALRFIVDRPREALYAGMKKRIAEMIALGWIDEVRNLLAQWGPEVRPMNSVGYRQVKAYLQGATDLEEMERLAYKATRTYSRRQRTWFQSTLGEKQGTTCEALQSADRMDAIARWLNDDNFQFPDTKMTT